MNSQSFEHFDTRRLNAISISEVARRLGCELHRMGSTYKVSCPWHDDRHPSLTLYERSDENHCHCFSCGNGGSVIDFVMQIEGWSFQQACQWLSHEFCISTVPVSSMVPKPTEKPVAKPKGIAYTYIPQKMLDAMVSVENSLCRCLMRMFRPDAVEWLVEEYRIGSYSMNGRDDYTVFPNIDRYGHVCNLKVQHYDTDTQSARFAHSDDKCFWLGTIWVREGRLPKDARFQSKCLFGEHLLPRYPNNLVILVESPKNALFGALAFPQVTWVATGNKGMLKRDVLQPLKGRNVIVIPDRDAISDWTAIIRSMDDLANFSVSSICQHLAPADAPKYDIADYLQQLRMAPF